MAYQEVLKSVTYWGSLLLMALGAAYWLTRDPPDEHVYGTALERKLYEDRVKQKKLAYSESE